MGLCPKSISEKASRVALTARQWPLLAKCHGLSTLPAAQEQEGPGERQV